MEGDETENMRVNDIFETSAALQGRTEIESTIRSITDPPVGAIIAWLKSLTNTPALASGWVECEGQTLVDPDSVYNGIVIPDLNGDNRFMRGNASSGGVGGAETMAHTHTSNVTIDNHTALALNAEGNHAHTVPMSADVEGGATWFGSTANPVSTSGAGGHTHTFSQDIDAHTANNPATSAATNEENRPPFYDVVWIMRVR